MQKSGNKKLYIGRKTGATRINNHLGLFQGIKKGVRQGCLLSTEMFSLYSKHIMRSIENMSDIVASNYNIHNLHYDDDTAKKCQKQ